MSGRPRRSLGPVAEITPEGALAAHVLVAVLVATGIAYALASWDELWRRCDRADGTCATSAAAAALVTMLALGLVAGAVAMERRVLRRPVDPEGRSGYVVGLGVLFAAGLLLVAWRLPEGTCDRGRYDPILDLCLHPPTTSDAKNLIPLKAALALLGVLGGVVIAARPRWAKLTAWLAVLAWIAGAGMLLVGTLVER
jgi:hypothetical protein